MQIDLRLSAAGHPVKQNHVLGARLNFLHDPLLIRVQRQKGFRLIGLFFPRFYRPAVQPDAAQLFQRAGDRRRLFAPFRQNRRAFRPQPGQHFLLPGR